MKHLSRIILWSVLLLLVSGGCTTTPREKSLKYPRKPASDPDRKAGPAMMLYEAAEEDADVNNVIVIPPSGKKKKQD